MIFIIDYGVNGQCSSNIFFGLLALGSRPTVRPANNSARMLSYQELPTSIQLWRGHGQEAKRGEAGEHRITREFEAIGSFLLPCRATGVSPRAVWCLIDATPR